MSDIDNRILGFEIKAAENMLCRNLCRVVAEVPELSGTQGPVLGFLQDKAQAGEDVFQKDIEKEFHIRRSTASIMLQTMEQKGMLRRESVGHDGRLKKIVLTQKGIDLDSAIRQHIDALHARLEQDITREEKEIFLQILDKIRKNLEM